jgi:hypothetical protein
MEAYCGSGGIALRILDLGIKWWWSASRHGRFTRMKIAPGTHSIGDWVGVRDGMDTVVRRKIPRPCQDSNPRSSSPYPTLYH